MEPFYRLSVFLLVLFPVPGTPPPLSVIDAVQSKRKKILKGIPAVAVWPGTSP